MAGLIVILFTVVGAGGSTWWYFQDKKLRDELWLKRDTAGNAEQVIKVEEVIRRQSDIAGELDTQTLRLADIEALINRHWQQRESRFEELESEHKMIMQGVFSSAADVREALGRHEGHQ